MVLTRSLAHSGCVRWTLSESILGKIIPGGKWYFLHYKGTSDSNSGNEKRIKSLITSGLICSQKLTQGEILCVELITHNAESPKHWVPTTMNRHDTESPQQWILTTMNQHNDESLRVPPTVSLTYLANYWPSESKHWTVGIILQQCLEPNNLTFVLWFSTDNVLHTI